MLQQQKRQQLSLDIIRFLIINNYEYIGINTCTFSYSARQCIFLQYTGLMWNNQSCIGKVISVIWLLTSSWVIIEVITLLRFYGKFITSKNKHKNKVYLVTYIYFDYKCMNVVTSFLYVISFQELPSRLDIHPGFEVSTRNLNPSIETSGSSMESIELVVLLNWTSRLTH